MSTWEEYPNDYRLEVVNKIKRATRAGDCVALLGLSGAGKSNVIGFLANRISNESHPMLLIDCNRLIQRTPDALFRLMRRAIEPTDTTAPPDEFDALDRAMAQYLTVHPRLTLLFDRFDTFAANHSLDIIAGPLRALRDSYKFKLTYVISLRHDISHTSAKSHNELAELFYANTLWLGALSNEDARWNIKRYAERRGEVWQEDIAAKIMALSQNYPSMLKAVAEAYIAGATLDNSIAQHPAVKQRVTEFWDDNPSEHEINLSGLAMHTLLLGETKKGKNSSLGFDTSQLTAKEAALLAYFQAHPNQLCPKDDIIQAVWTEDKVFTIGIRDDSLAQLVRRLREKIEPEPSSPKYIQTIPGRGYKFIDLA
jgi:energy-coupling factor transporter ATP-binding protein EcfA2